MANQTPFTALVAPMVVTALGRVKMESGYGRRGMSGTVVLRATTDRSTGYSSGGVANYPNPTCLNFEHGGFSSY